MSDLLDRQIFILERQYHELLGQVERYEARSPERRHVEERIWWLRRVTDMLMDLGDGKTTDKLA